MTSPPDFEFLRIERTDDDVVIATLDRPKVNALDTALLLEIGELAGALHAEPPGALVLTGGGRHFAAGADLTVFADPAFRQAQGDAFRSGFAALETVPCPTIAAVNGFALGGGFEMVQNCDLCVASENAEFAIVEPRWNLTGAWAANLTRQIGLRHALEMTIVPQRVPAQRAYEMGLVNWVVPPAQLMDKALEVANLILGNGPASVASFIEMYHRTYGMSHAEAVALGNHIQKHLLRMEDTVEGPRAFAEKRKPNFRNK